MKIFLLGNICNTPELLNVIEEANCVVVDDDICTGKRSFFNYIEEDNVIDRSSDPYEHLARIYINKFLCPSKIPRWFAEPLIIDQIVKSNAQGVIFLLIRLCDPHYLDYTLLSKAIEAKGFPTLVIEYDMHTTSFQQISTRIEAFCEIIKGY